MSLAGAFGGRTGAVRVCLILLIGLGCAAQGLALLSLGLHSDRVGWYLGLHFFGAELVASCLLYFALQRSLKRAWVFFVIFSFVAALFPVIGALLCIAFSVIINRAESHAQAPDHVIWEEGVTNSLPGHSVDADIDALKSHTLSGLGELRRESQSPFDSAARLVLRLHDDSPLIRRQAILPLVNLRSDHAAPMLKNAMEDGDEQVRLMAQNSLQSIRDRYDGLVVGLRGAVSREPDNPRHYLRLADVFTSLAELDLEKDSEIAVSYRVKAASWIALAASTPAAANDDELILDLLRRSLAMGRFDLARRFSRQLIHKGMKDVRLEEALIDMAYEDKEWDIMLEKLGKLPRAPFSRPELRFASDYWLHTDLAGREGAR